jgi:hypothetical protein
MLRSIVASTMAGLGMPLLVLLAISAWQWNWDWSGPFGARFIYLIIGPFTVVGAFAVAWPTHALLPSLWRPTVRTLAGLAICSAAAMVVLLPFSDEIPWVGAAFGAATYLAWLIAYRFAPARLPKAFEIGS